MLSFPDMLYLFPYKLSRLCAGPFSLPRILAYPLDRLFFQASVPPCGDLQFSVRSGPKHQSVTQLALAVGEVIVRGPGRSKEA